MAVYIESENIITSLGFTAAENVDAVLSGVSGVNNCSDRGLSPTDFPASYIENEKLEAEFSRLGLKENYTRFEKLCILSANQALRESKVNPTSAKTGFVFSTTKGNIELLDNEKAAEFSEDRAKLWKSAEVVAKAIGIESKPVVVSNACSSGVLAIVLAKRMLDWDEYENVIVLGADILTKFIVSGFQSFLSLSDETCKPFDKNRNGLTLGEGAATVILTKEKTMAKQPLVEIVSGASSNDANHISGPSRTGEGLFVAISKTLAEGQSVDFISAHGTATPYNDAMEAKAITRAGLSEVPVNSLKGYIGHTLGAAGIIESLISVGAMRANVLPKTLGFSEIGVEEDIHVISENSSCEISSLLKLSSGFGGVNAALFFQKYL